MQRFSIRALAHGTTLALLLSTVPVSANAQDGRTTNCPTSQPQKKGFGLRGLLGAAKRAGVSDMLGGRMGGNMFGSGKGGQIANAVAGQAIEAAGNAASATAQREEQRPQTNCATSEGKTK